MRIICEGCVVLFKQKTADEMRMSDWSADVGSADLPWIFTRAHIATGQSKIGKIAAVVENHLDQRQPAGVARYVQGTHDRAQRHALMVECIEQILLNFVHERRKRLFSGRL